MTLIYLQDTINYMHRLDPNLLNQLNIYGTPEVKDLTTKEGGQIKYYRYVIEDDL
jgi:hypothetical protein